ncbi:MAG: DUF2612 domain-containing protein [Clostridium sp.]|nr:DUF2612 domain-containing protein [Clostridium sp.]
MFKEMLSRLTDNYNKSPKGNVGKLLNIMTAELEELKKTLGQVEAWKDIDKAEGVTLDHVGRTVIQPRGVATDEVYRILLKSKIARNLSTGDINTIINVLAVALDTDYSEITIEEMYNDPLEPEPAAIKIIQLPLQQVNEAGMSPNQFAKIVQRTVAAGVKVGVIELTGTFEFSEDLESDNEKGFSNDLQDIGGYLGYLYEPSYDDDLPI